MANSYLDKEGLLYFLQKIRANATPSMDGTAATGTAKRFALQDHVHPSDTTKAPLASPALTGTPTAPTAATGTSTTQIATTEFVANTVGAMTSGVSDVKIDNASIVTSGVANIPIASGDVWGVVKAQSYNAQGTGDIYSTLQVIHSNASGTGTTTSTVAKTALASTSGRGLMSPSDKTKLNGIESGAEVNQNAFSNVKVGSTTIEADAKTDTLELVAGSNVTLTPDATNDTVTIAATDTTYSDATTSTHGLMSTADKAKLDNISGLTLDIVAGTNVTVTPDTTNGTLTIASTDTKNTAGSTNSTSKLYLVGATTQGSNPQTYSRASAYVDTDGHLYSNSIQTVNLSDSQALTNKTYNGYTLGAACAKGVVTSISADSADVPTVTAVKNYITTAITGAASFQGTAPTTFAPTNYKKGWYWVVGTAGTYVGEVCEAGDMIFAVNDYSSAYSASDFSVIQTNLDITSITNAEIDVIVAS